jgi:hypothetical protein
MQTLNENTTGWHYQHLADFTHTVAAEARKQNKKKFNTVSLDENVMKGTEYFVPL